VYYDSAGELNELGQATNDARSAGDPIVAIMRQFNRDQQMKKNDVALAQMGRNQTGDVSQYVPRKTGNAMANRSLTNEAMMNRQLSFDASRKQADNQNRVMGQQRATANQPRERGPLANNRDAPERVAFRQAMNDAAAARNRAGLNFAEQRMREQMMRRITAQGHTPFNDVMRARQRNAMGF
jgi:hypothetical protein